MSSTYPSSKKQHPTVEVCFPAAKGTELPTVIKGLSSISAASSGHNVLRDAGSGNPIATIVKTMSGSSIDPTYRIYSYTPLREGHAASKLRKSAEGGNDLFPWATVSFESSKSRFGQPSCTIQTFDGDTFVADLLSKDSSSHKEVKISTQHGGGPVATLKQSASRTKSSAWEVEGSSTGPLHSSLLLCFTVIVDEVLQSRSEGKRRRMAIRQPVAIATGERNHQRRGGRR